MNVGSLISGSSAFSKPSLYIWNFSVYVLLKPSLNSFEHNLANVLLLLFSHLVMSDSATSWTVVHQAPLFIGFPKQEYWSGLPFSSPGDLPNPGTEPMSPILAGKFSTAVPHGKQFRLLINITLYYETLKKI